MPNAVERAAKKSVMESSTRTSGSSALSETHGNERFYAVNEDDDVLSDL